MGKDHNGFTRVRPYVLFLLLTITLEIPMEKVPSQKDQSLTKQPGLQSEAQGKWFFYPYYCLFKAMQR